MRLNRQNTLIEDNLQPCSGMTPDEIQKKFVNAMKPYEEFVNQIQAALYLINVKLYVALCIAVAAVIAVFSLLICSSVPNTIVFIITIPIIELFYCFDAHIAIKKLFIEIPKDKKIKSLEELAALFWRPVLTIWRIGFFVYRTFVYPNAVDTIVFILAALAVGFINKFIPIFVIIALALVAFVVLPPVLVTVNGKAKEE